MACKDAKEEFLSKLEQKLTCAVCMELYNEPQLLPCQHVLCEGCVNQQASGGSLTCPLCREMVSLAAIVADERMKKLREVFEIEQALGGNDHQVCDQCERLGENGSVCSTCGQELCHVCTKSHPKLKKGHVVKSGAEAEGEARAELEKRLQEAKELKKELEKHEKECEEKHQVAVKEALDKISEAHRTSVNEILQYFQQQRQEILMQEIPEVEDQKKRLSSLLDLLNDYKAAENMSDAKLVTTYGGLKKRLDALKKEIEETPEFEIKLEIKNKDTNLEAWDPEKACKITFQLQDS